MVEVTSFEGLLWWGRIMKRNKSAQVLRFHLRQTREVCSYWKSEVKIMYGFLLNIAMEGLFIPLHCYASN